MITRQILRPLATASTRQWVCPSCSTGIVSSLRNASTTFPPATERRAIYNRPLLNYDEQFWTEGVSGLFSKNGYKLGWIEYQDLLMLRLNELTADKSYAGKDIKELVLRSAHQPQQASLFNHASMAHNNHFFWQQFSPHPRRLDQFPALYSSLVDAFGSIESLRKTLVDTASAMFGPGFVWLVWARDPDNVSGVRDGGWKILSTYSGGTPYPEAGFMQQSLEMNTSDDAAFARYKQSNVGYFGPSSRIGQEKARIPPGGTTVMPVLCVSTWEHTYIYDYGLKGKLKYLDSFWDTLDWQVVSNRAPQDVNGKLGGRGIRA
ncbi:hypothetical protein AMS68_005443 [Peltaster fructicola]|uniref:Manganese/iron superoxide dismutase C-terminal domain-containing protein n=1 Tax=Peltaster fructicola TaxID=286661 RepID=A0A6H0XZ16_9PEZI|nr:hypothetical protein AMS68_005443 [Peltaster fructicola]